MIYLFFLLGTIVSLFLGVVFPWWFWVLVVLAGLRLIWVCLVSLAILLTTVTLHRRNTCLHFNR